jgi:hypothetical protein
MDSSQKFLVIFFGGLLALGALSLTVESCANQRQQNRQAAEAEEKEKQRQVRIAAAKAAFNALTPQQHFEAATDNFKLGRLGDVERHLAKVPEEIEGRSELKNKFEKLQAKLKAEQLAKVKSEEIAKQKAAKELERINKEENRKLHAQWRKEGVNIGMTSERVLLSSWGRPEKVNRTTYSRGVHEQWVYSGGYLYFEDGILTAIQN